MSLKCACRRNPFALYLKSGRLASAKCLEQLSRAYCATSWEKVRKLPANLEKLPMVPVSDSQHSAYKIANISKAMAAYLKGANERSQFISQEVEKYELGKRHLANMMGFHPDQMTQDDIDHAIQYLLPSGLFSARSRPVMKHPEELFPKMKSAQFDADGRPFHSMFYTLFPSFYEVLFSCAEKSKLLDEFQDSQLAKGVNASAETLNLTGTVAMSLERLQDELVEKIDQSQYQHFLAAMNHLIEHPCSFKEKEFIMRFRVAVGASAGVPEVFAQPETFHDSSGRQGAKAVGYRRRHSASVILLTNGSGKVTLDGHDIAQLSCHSSREVILTPFTLLKCLGKYDVEATTSGGGDSTKASAVRHAISQALCAFVTDADREKLRLAGLLSRDSRRHERKKVGQPGARKKWTWYIRFPTSSFLESCNVFQEETLRKH